MGGRLFLFSNRGGAGLCEAASEDPLRLTERSKTLRQRFSLLLQLTQYATLESPYDL